MKLYEIMKIYLLARERRASERAIVSLVIFLCVLFHLLFSFLIKKKFKIVEFYIIIKMFNDPFHFKVFLIRDSMPR